MKQLPLELPIPFRMVHSGLGHSEQRRKSIFIHGHAQNREPLPLTVVNVYLCRIKTPPCFACALALKRT